MKKDLLHYNAIYYQRQTAYGHSYTTVACDALAR